MQSLNSRVPGLRKLHSRQYRCIITGCHAGESEKVNKSQLQNKDKEPGSCLSETISLGYRHTQRQDFIYISVNHVIFVNVIVIWHLNCEWSVGKTIIDYRRLESHVKKPLMNFKRKKLSLFSTQAYSQIL